MSFIERLFGPPDIEELKAKGDVEGLIKALGYEKDERVRQAAARALGEIGDKRAVEPLIAALKDEVWSGGRAAAEALERIGTPVVEPLLDVLRDDSSSVRWAAAELLGRIADAGAVDSLTAALRDERARKAAIKVLDELGWQPNRSEAGAAYWIAKGDLDRCVEIGAPAVEPLIAALKHDDRRVRQAAAGALGRIGDTRAVEPLMDALQDVVREARPTAATQMAEIRKLLAMLPVCPARQPYSYPTGSGDMDTLLQFLDTRLVDELCRWDRYVPGEFIRQVKLTDWSRWKRFSDTVWIDATFLLPSRWAYEKTMLRVTRIGNDEFAWVVRVDTSAGDM